MNAQFMGTTGQKRVKIMEGVKKTPNSCGHVRNFLTPRKANPSFLRTPTNLFNKKNIEMH